LSDFNPELEQFAMDARRSPKRVINAHPPDQCAQLHLDLRSPSQRVRSPTPKATKARSMPTHQHLGTDDRENLQDRRKPPIQLNKKPTIAVEPWPTAHLALQNDQPMAEHRILSFKPALRLEWRGKNPQNET
jgi:hypothetical protein